MLALSRKKRKPPAPETPSVGPEFSLPAVLKTTDRSLHRYHHLLSCVSSLANRAPWSRAETWRHLGWKEPRPRRCAGCSVSCPSSPPRTSPPALPASQGKPVLLTEQSSGNVEPNVRAWLVAACFCGGLSWCKVVTVVLGSFSAEKGYVSTSYVYEYYTSVSSREQPQHGTTQQKQQQQPLQPHYHRQTLTRCKQRTKLV